MKPSEQPIYILSEDDFDRIVTMTERYKMALYEFIGSRELEPPSAMILPQEAQFYKTSDEMIWEALGDGEARNDLF